MTAALVERNRSRAGQARSGSRSRPKLKVLNQQAIRQRARRRHALLALFIVVLCGFFAVAFVHAELVADQQQLDSIRTRIAEAEAHNAKIARAAEEASSPQAIVSRATELGMVRAHEPVYLAAAAPLRDVPTAVSFRTAEIVAAEGVAAPADGDTTIAVGISAVAQVQAAAPEVAASASGDVVNTESAAVESATTPAVETAPIAETAPIVETAPVVAVADETATVVGSSAVASTSNPVASNEATTATPAAAVPSGSSFGGVSAEQAPTSIAGIRADTGGVAGATVAPQGQATEEEGTSRFGGMSAGTGSG